MPNRLALLLVALVSRRTPGCVQSAGLSTALLHRLSRRPTAGRTLHGKALSGPPASAEDTDGRREQIRDAGQGCIRDLAHEHRRRDARVRQHVAKSVGRRSVGARACGAGRGLSLWRGTGRLVHVPDPAVGAAPVCPSVSPGPVRETCHGRAVPSLPHPRRRNPPCRRPTPTDVPLHAGCRTWRPARTRAARRR